MWSEGHESAFSRPLFPINLGCLMPFDGFWENFGERFRNRLAVCISVSLSSLIQDLVPLNLTNDIIRLMNGFVSCHSTRCGRTSGKSSGCSSWGSQKKNSLFRLHTDFLRNLISPRPNWCHSEAIVHLCIIRLIRNQYDLLKTEKCFLPHFLPFSFLFKQPR